MHPVNEYHINYLLLNSSIDTANSFSIPIPYATILNKSKEKVKQSDIKDYVFGSR